MDQEVIRLSQDAAQFVRIYEPWAPMAGTSFPTYGLSFPATLVRLLDLSQVRLGKSMVADGTWEHNMANCRSRRKIVVEAWWDGALYTAEEKGDKWVAFKRELDILEARNIPRDAIFSRYPLEVTVSKFAYNTNGHKGEALAIERLVLLKP